MSELNRFEVDRLIGAIEYLDKNGFHEPALSIKKLLNKPNCPKLESEAREAERRGFEKMRLAVVLFFQERLEAARQQESKNGIVLFEKWVEFFQSYSFDGGSHHVQ